MNLTESLRVIAEYLSLDAAELAAYASEDVIGGYAAQGPSEWKIGSIYGVEGQTLYALIRALKPAHVAEIGSLWGCSSTHLATALDINGEGKLTAVDVTEHAGQNRPNFLAKIVTQVVSDGLEWLAAQPDESIDILFEDSSHGTEMCAYVGMLSKSKLKPGGVLLVHDAAHDSAKLEDGREIPSTVGYEIRLGLDRGLGEGTYITVKTEPSDCGFAIAVPNPKRTNVYTPDGDVLEVVEAPPVETVEKPKRGRKPKAKSE